MLNEKNDVISNVFLASQINYHKEFGPFARRPLTTFLIETTANLSGITLGRAFIWVNFSLFFLAGTLLFRLSKELNSGYFRGLINIILFFLSFSVIFAFFPPVFSYDEPLQYCLVFAGLTSFLKRQWLGYVLWFTAAMIARENTVVLILGLLVFMAGSPFYHKNTSYLGRLYNFLCIGMPVLLYGVYLLFYMEINGLWANTYVELQDRFHCLKENFRDTQRSIETLVSIFLSLGVFTYFIYRSHLRNTRVNHKRFVQAFYLSCSANIIIVLVAAFSREARLFSLPLVFIWPIVGQYCYREISLLFSYRAYQICFSKIKFLAFLGVLTLLNYLISFKVYVPTPPSSDNYFNEYLFMSILVVYLHFLLKHFTEKATVHLSSKNIANRVK